jgi:hypothetical protein
MDAALGGELDFQFFHAWFNGLFLASALVSLAAFWWHYSQVGGGGLGGSRGRWGSGAEMSHGREVAGFSRGPVLKEIKGTRLQHW